MTPLDSRGSVNVLDLACCSLEAEWADHVVDELQGLNVLVVAGTVTNVLADRVRAAFAALPEPRAVVAYGVCTITGGPYWDSYAVMTGIDDLVPVDLHVPGCPPPPAALTAALRSLPEVVAAGA